MVNGNVTWVGVTIVFTSDSCTGR